MNATQQIFRVRRNYNQWVNNQTLEDYALRFTAKGARRWSLSRVANTALGAISFLALEAIGGAITLSYGFDNASVAIFVVSTLILLAGIPICYFAAKYGVDIDLLTRGAGFGYIGSTATSLIYASFTFIFFALEAAIMAMVLELLFNIPPAIGYVICSLAVIPLVTHGITFISRFQLWTQPLWIVLQILPFAYLLFHEASLINDWTQFEGLKNQTPGQLNLLYFGAASAVMFALIAQIGEQVDYLRFLPEQNSQNYWRWWSALLCAGPGWIVIGAIKIFAGSLLAFVALSHGISSTEASDPARMYIVAYGYISQTPEVALILGGLFVIVSQLKINVTNAYAGSIAWSNFFSRLTHSHPGRVVWLVFNVAIALLLMELGVYHAFEHTLGVYAIVAVAWVGALVADLIVNKPLKLSPSYIEFRRAYLHDINPVGVGSMLIASLVGIACYLNVFGEVYKALAHFITLGVAFVLAPLIAYFTGGRFYIARPVEIIAQSGDCETQQCCICQNSFETEDIAFCPAYDGPICSLCCSLDSRCQDLCKSVKTLGEICGGLIAHVLPRNIVDYFNARLVHFCLLLFCIAGVAGVLLLLVYSNTMTGVEGTDSLLAAVLWKVFFILIIVAGVITWLFVLAHESRVVAQDESQRQNRLLTEEVVAHKQTDKALQQAKEKAEAANSAKSRYLTGISHELRSPLNSILGYAQLLENETTLEDKHRYQMSVIRRSGEHLADLIEGLLDISKIEAGRLNIHRDKVRISALMDQLVYMFRLQAEEKGLDFRYHCESALPEFVATDEKRLRQVLINLLSNAIKFTERGEVNFSLRYRNQVAEFTIQDSGVGIPEEELERIFKPFERVRLPGMPLVGGTGLGLTITRLLVEIMGGDIDVKNNRSGGSTFSVRLMLSHVVAGELARPLDQRICGYVGERKTLMVVDDDASHRGLLSDILSPIGFAVLESPDAESCLATCQSFVPDLFLLDISMPGKDGLSLAEDLRASGIRKPIIMVSAVVKENKNASGMVVVCSEHYDDYLLKPIKLPSLLDKIRRHLDLRWQHASLDVDAQQSPGVEHPYTGNKALPSAQVVAELCELAEIGHLSGLNAKIKALESKGDVSEAFIMQMKTFANGVQFEAMLHFLRSTHMHNNDLKVRG